MLDSISAVSALKVTRERFLVKTAALKAAAGVPTDDLTLAALISAAQCSSQQQIMESGNGGGGGEEGLMDKLGCSLALKADLMYGTTLGY